VELAQTLIYLGFSIATAVAALFLGSYAGRRAANDAEFKLRADFDSLGTAAANLASQTRDYMERAYQHAQRAAAHTSKAAAREEQQQAAQPMTQDDYLAHLQKGGGVIPEVERALGLSDA